MGVREACAGASDMRKCRCLVLPLGPVPGHSLIGPHTEDGRMVPAAHMGLHDSHRSHGAGVSTQHEGGTEAQGLWNLGGVLSLAPSSRRGHTPAAGIVPLVLEEAPQAPALALSACTPGSPGCAGSAPSPAAVALWNSLALQCFDLQHTWRSVPCVHPPSSYRSRTLCGRPRPAEKGWLKPPHQASSSSATPGRVPPRRLPSSYGRIPVYCVCTPNPCLWRRLYQPLGEVCPQRPVPTAACAPRFSQRACSGHLLLISGKPCGVASFTTWQYRGKDPFQSIPAPAVGRQARPCGQGGCQRPYVLGFWNT